MATDMILSDFSSELRHEVLDMLTLVNRSSDHLQQLIQDILEQSKEAHLLAKHKKKVDLVTFLSAVAELTDLPNRVKFDFHKAQAEVKINAVLWNRIFLNLFVNAIKYNSKPNPLVRVIFEQTDQALIFHVSDNGDGIESVHGDAIFDIFEKERALPLTVVVLGWRL